MEQEIKEKKAELENLTKKNEVSKSQIMHKEYKEKVKEGEDIDKTLKQKEMN